MPDSKSLSADAFLLVLAGLAGVACQKSAPSLKAEKTQGDKVEHPVDAKEVSAPAAKPSGASQSCVPGGCAPGKCAGAAGAKP